MFIDAPPAIREATSAALGTWHVDHMLASVTSQDMSAQERARMVALERQVTAVAWLQQDGVEGITSLHLFHRERGLFLSRVLSVRPPFTDASAASIALTLKTLLQDGEALPETTEPDLLMPRIPLARTFGVSTGLAAATLLSSGWTEPRLALAVEWGPLHAPYAVASHLAMGVPHLRDHGEAQAEFSEMSVGVELRRGFSLPMGFDAIVHLGASLHRARFALDPAAVDTVPFTRIHWNPGVCTGMRLRRHITWRVSAEISAAVGYRAQTQTYHDLDMTILRTPRGSVDLGLGLHMVLGR